MIMRRYIPTQQQGSALIVSLSILLVLTVLGISSMSTTALQERMAGNARDSEVAFEAAEAGLRAGETYINGLTDSALPSFDGTSGLYPISATQTYAWQTESNWTNAVQATFSMHVSSQPTYIIQALDTTVAAPPAQGLESASYNNNPPVIVGNVKVFQVTARGYGLSSTSRVMLQSYYGKAF